MRNLIAKAMVVGLLGGAGAVAVPAVADAATWHQPKHHTLHYMQPGHVKDTQWCKLSDTQWG